MDDKRYYGRDVELVFSEAPTAQELEQAEGWADRIQQMSGPHRITYVDMGPQGDRQLEEMMQYLTADDELGTRMGRPREGQSAIMLGPLTDPEFRRYNYVVPQKRKGLNKGKGQRKANRRDRWR